MASVQLDHAVGNSHSQAKASGLLPLNSQPGDDIVCCICFNGDVEPENEIVFCDKCDIAGETRILLVALDSAATC